jgi:hypothetical protein
LRDHGRGAGCYARAMSLSPPRFLVDIVRARRALAPDEVWALVRGLAEKLDANDIWTLNPTPLIYQIEIRCVEPLTHDRGTDIWSLPISSWPPVQLEIAASGLGTDVERTLDDELTVRPRKSDDRVGAPAGRFARMLYDLLGGPVKPAEPGRFSPLPSLNEAANAALCNGVESTVHRSCTSVWLAWEMALPRKDRRIFPGMQRWRVPSELIQVPTAVEGSDRLDLIPTGGAEVTIRLVSSDTFRLGRSRTYADWPVHVWEAGRYSPEKTKLLSRVHAVASRLRGGFLDGDGHVPSANGSAYIGSRLDVDNATPVGGGGELMLGPECGLQVKVLPSPGTWPWQLDGETSSAPTILQDASGAVLFVPREIQPTVREALWLHREVGFEISKRTRPRWGQDARGAEGWLVRRSDGFWLANARAPLGALEVDGVTIAHGEIAPLKAGQRVRMNSETWECRAVVDETVSSK